MKSVIEILGPWLPNKGDDMMLHAVAERLQASHVLAVSSTLGLSDLPEKPALHQVKWKPTLKEVGAAVGSGSLRSMSSVLRRGIGLTVGGSTLRARGLVDGREIVALLDCSGFAYGDQWPADRLASRATYYDRLLAQGVKLVMLPQALGPFDTTLVRGAARMLLDRFHLIFARDHQSAEHTLALGIDPRKVAVCPDVTHLLEPKPPGDRQAWMSRVCIVPNSRMLDRTSPEVSKRYMAFLLRSIVCIHDCGLEPCVLLHETFDQELIREVGSRSHVPVKVFDEDALTTKSFLGACFANVGSRYHSLVSSLSQATPSIGTSWAHKYEALFAEYQSTDCLLSPSENAAEVDSKLRRFLEPRQRQERHARLRPLAAVQKQKVSEMWSRVEALLEGATK